MNIQVLDNLFKASDKLNNDMTYGDFCHILVPNNTDGVLCYSCRFYKGYNKGGCMLNNALSILDDAKSAYELLKNN